MLHAIDLVKVARLFFFYRFASVEILWYIFFSSSGVCLNTGKMKIYLILRVSWRTYYKNWRENITFTIYRIDINIKKKKKLITRDFLREKYNSAEENMTVILIRSIYWQTLRENTHWHITHHNHIIRTFFLIHNVITLNFPSSLYEKFTVKSISQVSIYYHQASWCVCISSSFILHKRLRSVRRTLSYPPTIYTLKRRKKKYQGQG